MFRQTIIKQTVSFSRTFRCTQHRYLGITDTIMGYGNKVMGQSKGNTAYLKSHL